MAVYLSIGGFLVQQKGRPVTWTTAFDQNLDHQIVVQAPNISDDFSQGPAQLVVLNQAVIAGEQGVFYQVTIQNPGPRPVRYNLNIQDPL